VTTYFFDANVSYRYANMLRALEQDVWHISKARGFDRRDSDIVWMPKVAEMGWVAVTLDRRILRVAVENYVREKVGLRVVFLAEGFLDKPFFEQAKFLLHAWEPILKATARSKPGECFRVTVRGHVERMKTKSK
jgi:hypothetical protein